MKRRKTVAAPAPGALDKPTGAPPLPTCDELHPTSSTNRCGLPLDLIDVRRVFSRREDGRFHSGPHRWVR